MKLTACEVMETAMLAGMNAPKFNGYGAMRAGRDMATAELVAALDPMRCDGHYSQDAAGVPTVKINYFLEQDVAPKLAFDCAVGAKGVPAQTTFQIKQYLQDGLGFTSKEYSALCCDVDAYLQSQYRGISVQGSPEAAMALRKFSALGQFKQQVINRMNSSILNPLNNYALSKLVAGYNPVHATAAQVPVIMKDGAGRWTTNILEEINTLKLETGYCGQYIAIGGTKWAQWFGGECGMPNVTCCSDLGVNFQAVRDNLPFTFYFDRFIDAAYGAGSLILIEAGAFALLNFDQQQFWGDSACCESYGKMGFQFDSCCEPSMAINFDTWATTKGLCATGGAGPETDLFWSIKYDAWVKPFSFTHGSAPLNAQTGIYHYKWQ